MGKLVVICKTCVKLANANYQRQIRTALGITSRLHRDRCRLEVPAWVPAHLTITTSNKNRQQESKFTSNGVLFSSATAFAQLLILGVAGEKPRSINYPARAPEAMNRKITDVVRSKLELLKIDGKIGRIRTRGVCN